MPIWDDHGQTALNLQLGCSQKLWAPFGYGLYCGAENLRVPTSDLILGITPLWGVLGFASRFSGLHPLGCTPGFGHPFQGPWRARV